jgi:hypothetical protein
MDVGELKKREEAKRAAAYDPAARWRHIQDQSPGPEENVPVHLRRNRPRTRTPKGSPSAPWVCAFTEEADDAASGNR